MSRRPHRASAGTTVVFVFIMLLMIAATGLMVWLTLGSLDTPVDQDPYGGALVLPDSTLPQPTETDPPETTLPVPEHVVSTATIGSMGDILMHMPVVDTGRQSDGSYDFESIFRYITDDITALDFAVANLETTLCGTDNGYPYKGFPHFNCPDAIVTSAYEAGFDTLLTANNHSYDTVLVGFKRTLEVTRAAGLGTLGTMLTAEEPKFVVQEINGINIGLICYTYGESRKGSVSLNGNAAVGEPGLVNFFDYNDLPAFYEELQGHLDAMKAQGAEATMVYMHWGVEYQLYANENQKKIAQKLCDMGVDVIVGGHPHVVQPVDLLESTVDPQQKTVIIYSMGNAVSNQRLGNISTVKTAHTEDGALFTVTFEKYSDGSVYLAEADVIPTWVNMSTVNGKKEYNILPLVDSRRDTWQTSFNLTDALMTKAENSYARTQAVLGEGLMEVQTWLAEQKEAREQYYYDLAFFPEKFAAEPTETVPETTAETTLPAAA